MILLIDNYDSFTYNIVQRLGEINPELDVRTYRNDELSLDDIRGLNPERIILSPGPCTPNEAGICLQIVESLHSEYPILGVCLGHQSIGQAFGGKIVRAPKLMHGKTDCISHDNRGLFEGVPNPFVATRYHSLVILPESLPDCLEVSAWVHDDNGNRIIMGVRHKRYAVEGWQFHPESFLTEPGVMLLSRFLKWRGPVATVSSQ
ncbi:MAG: aminodeoxychorismate/anthranilate synthase component II [Pirellula sp.]|jgi:anthranilate synthase component 2|nr:aminodeoxychorismate/anthranilate synthase component II [Pirellula sp.]